MASGGLSPKASGSSSRAGLQSGREALQLERWRDHTLLLEESEGLRGEFLVDRFGELAAAREHVARIKAATDFAVVQSPARALRIDRALAAASMRKTANQHAVEMRTQKLQERQREREAREQRHEQGFERIHASHKALVARKTASAHDARRAQVLRETESARQAQARPACLRKNPLSLADSP